jgi:hypothetical protein
VTDSDSTVFLNALAFQLRLCGVPVLRSELGQWLADVWPLAADDPSPGH